MRFSSLRCIQQHDVRLCLTLPVFRRARLRGGGIRPELNFPRTGRPPSTGAVPLLYLTPSPHPKTPLSHLYRFFYAPQILRPRTRTCPLTSQPASASPNFVSPAVLCRCVLCGEKIDDQSSFSIQKSSIQTLFLVVPPQKQPQKHAIHACQTRKDVIPRCSTSKETHYYQITLCPSVS